MLDYGFWEKFEIWSYVQNLYGFIYMMYSKMDTSYNILSFHTLSQNQLQLEI